jgi:hypothetical protein
MQLQSYNAHIRPLSGLPTPQTGTPVQPKQPEGPSEPQDVGEIKEEKDWTVLFYMNGNNASASECVTAMRQLEFIGSNDKTHMAAQLARPKAMLDGWSKDWNGVRRYEIVNNGQEFNTGVIIADSLTGFLPGKTKGIKSPVLQELENADMGSARTLEEFLEWGVKKFPAKNYMVVMMGPSEGVSGMMHDVISENHMSVADLGTAFRNAQAKTGKKIDVLAMPGSATNSLEVAYELKDQAKLLVGSQGISNGQSMPLAMVMNEINNVNKDGARDGLALAQYMLLMNSMAPGSLSIVDLEKIGPAKEAWDNLAKSMLEAGIDRDKLNSLLQETQDFQGASKNEAYGNSRDAIHFATLVRDDAEISSEKVKEAAAKAVEALEGSLLGDVANGKYLENANGISVFAPTNFGYMRPDGTSDEPKPLRDAGYSDTNFAKDTQWDELLSGGAKDSSLNSGLKKLGMSEVTVDKVHGLYNQHSGKASMLTGMAGMAGWLNGINAWRGTGPAGFMVLNAQQAVYAGIASAGVDAAKGVGRAWNGATELGDRNEVAQGVMDVGAAGLKAVANLGFVVPGMQPYAATAGALMFFSPWLRNIYGVFEQYKSIEEGTELGIGTNSMPTTQKVGAAVLRHVGENDLKDHHERSLWQKFAG